MSDTHNLSGEEYFKRSRYNKQYILAEFEKIETINKVFDLDISQSNDIEIHVNKQVNRDFIKEVLSEIPEFDNYIQDFCELCSKNSTIGAENFRVELAWLSITQNKVVMGYWGEIVNIELRAIFVKKNEVWEDEEIYWQ